MKHSSSKKIRDKRSETVTTSAVTASPANAMLNFATVLAHSSDSAETFASLRITLPGLIRGVSLRRRGAVRGKRLWSIDSIRSYLESQMENGGEV